MKALFPLLVALLSGCASTAEHREIGPGHVALVSAQYPPEADFNAYAYGRGVNAAKGGGVGALKGAGIGAYVPLKLAQGTGTVGMGVGLFLAVPMAAAGAVVGGTVGIIHGAATGMDSDQVSAIHDPITRLRRGTEVQTAIAERVLTASVEHRRHTVTYLPEAGPNAWRAAPHYEGLRSEGFDSVLELEVRDIGFEARPGDPPSARFGMKLRARVVPLVAGTTPWQQEWIYHGGWRAVAAWQSDRGQLLAQELDTALDHLALRILSTFSLSARPQPVMGLPIALDAPTPGPLPVPGDTWTYRVTEPQRGAPRVRSHQVEIVSVTPEAIGERSAKIPHREGNYLASESDLVLFSPYLGAFDPAFASLPAAGLALLDPKSCDVQWLCSVSASVVGNESVRVPAGEFDAVKLEVRQSWSARAPTAYPNGARTLTIWYAPQAKRAVKFSSRGTAGAHFKANFDVELEKYRLN